LRRLRTVVAKAVATGHHAVVRVASVVVLAALLSGGVSCSSSPSLANPDRFCGQVLTAGNSAALPGQRPSKTPDKALGLFLRLNAVPPTTTPPTFDPSRFLGVMPLPMTGWIRVKAMKGVAAYEHRKAGGHSDYSLDFTRTGEHGGWSITQEGRCGA